MRIQLLYKYIAHDVKQLTLRYANARLTDNPELADQAAFGENDSDEQLLRRWVVTGTARLRVVLRDYISKKTENADDTLTDKETWGFNFTNDVADSHGTAELMHWFVVKWCMWQWLLQYAPSEANATKNELDELEDDLNKVFSDSDMPTKERREKYVDVDEIVVTYEPA